MKVTRILLSSLFLLALSTATSSAATIRDAVFDPDPAGYVSYGSLSLTGSETLEFDTDSGELKINNTVQTYVAVDVTADNGDTYKAFIFDSFNVGSNVTIDVIPGTPNAAPVNGLAILSIGDFTLNTLLEYGDATTGQGNPGGNISLVSQGDMTLTSVIQSQGGNGKNSDGYDAGLITIATGGLLDASSATFDADGGDADPKKNGNGGDAGTVTIFANEITGDFNDLNITAAGGAGNGTGTSSGLDVNPLDFTDVDFPDGDLSYLTTAIPEPSSALLALIAGNFFLLRRKRA
ncbi:hypothetical protein [Rubritalea tangerina]|uniref:PEP-CTERM protein-sorting domain-containing protein n=1 Tax=Rubritalea tangerina TaxID=430798 RepID=A0ABW4ZDM3_9BACT